MVHICGAVVKPGVYLLPADARLEEAVKAAGGFTPEAAANYENLAARLRDGEKVWIPKLEEVGDDPYGAEIRQQKSDAAEPESPSAISGKVNINTADQAALMTLPGIGESKAAAILNYRREHGPFSSPEAIMQVPGIKEGAFQKIKDRITTEP